MFTALTHSVRPVTTADIPCVLGSDTECMTQVIYKWTPYRLDWKYPPEKLPELFVLETQLVNRKIRHMVQLKGRMVDQGTILIDGRY